MEPGKTRRVVRVTADITEEGRKNCMGASLEIN
jgi:hypothetical protein